MFPDRSIWRLAAPLRGGRTTERSKRSAVRCWAGVAPLVGSLYGSIEPVLWFKCFVRPVSDNVQPFSRSATRISACSPRCRQCPDSTVTGAFNSGHACTGIRIESHNSEVPRLDHLRISENSGILVHDQYLSDGAVLGNCCLSRNSTHVLTCLRLLARHRRCTVVIVVFSSPAVPSLYVCVFDCVGWGQGMANVVRL